MKRVLIIDDDMDMCLLLSNFLKKKGFQTTSAYTGASGITTFKNEAFDICLCDFRLGDKEGREVLMEIKRIQPNVPVVIFTGYSDIRTAVDIIKMGAFDYITKPLLPEEVLSVLNAALEYKEDPKNVKQPSKISVKGDFLIGQDPLTKELYKQVYLVAPTPYSVIIYGESGTGKEVIAKTIHNHSERKDKPFIALDCGTLSRELAGSELFGHVKGSFTGALQDKLGHFELANGGTLFLDEVANLPLDVQATMLRVIQERRFKKVGGTSEAELDIRIIVASNENLQDAYKNGKFREDLFHRFNEFSIHIPPLRERKKDVNLFAAYFLERASEELSRNITGFDDEVTEIFRNYKWPGNLREFKNVIRRAALLSVGENITKTVLPKEMLNEETEYVPVSVGSVVLKSDTPNLKGAASQAEYETILQVLKQVNYNKTKAAEILKIDRKTLYNKIKEYEALKG